MSEVPTSPSPFHPLLHEMGPTARQQMIPASSSDMPSLPDDPVSESHGLDMAEVPTSPSPFRLLFQEMHHASTIPASLSDVPLLPDDPFSESHRLDMAEVPTSKSPSPFRSLLHEMQHASRQQTTPSTMPHPPHSHNTSSIHSRAWNTLPPLPILQFVGKVNFIMNIEQALNHSLDALSVSSKGIGGLRYLVYKHKVMRGILTFLSFILQAVLQLMYIGAVYLPTWLSLGWIHTRTLPHRILSIHPFLPLFVSSLQSLHTATIFYLCILYIQEARIMATEVDPELIIA